MKLPKRPSDRRHPRARTRGQTLVEFALVFPLFFMVMLGLIEFAFAFNAVLSTNFASRAAALLAAEAGNATGADCVILKSIEDEMTAPADKARISEVVVYRANPDGTPVGGGQQTRYVRSAGGMSCTFAGTPPTTVTVPFVISGADGYPVTARCNELAGCGSPVQPLHTIGVRIGYSHTWVTPMGTWLPGSSTGWSFSRQNAMRMEPIL
jgi:Flp pilus assembly protein TadG